MWHIPKRLKSLQEDTVVATTHVENETFNPEKQNESERNQCD